MLPLLLLASSLGAIECPDGLTQIDTFVINGTSWSACEDLQVPGGALVLVPEGGQPEWFPKSYSHYGSAHDDDPSYYLGLGRQNVSSATADILGIKMLDKDTAPGGLSWQLVADAVPPMRTTGGVRAFVGSRGSVADTTFSDQGEDAAAYGFPPPHSYVFNLTNLAEGGKPLRSNIHGTDLTPYINASGMADGLVGGGDLPVVIYYFPVLSACNVSNVRKHPVHAPPPRLQGPPHQCCNVFPKDIPVGASRYWTMVANPTPDMGGSREQGVWFRFVQIECTGPEMAPPCKQIGAAQYWDTYWWTRTPGAAGDTGITGPTDAADASGFYATLLENRRWWSAELAKEGMMELSLPSRKTTTNGTWLSIQAHHNVVLSMITKHDTWGPRYGVLPGYGIEMQNGFEDVFTSLGMMALELGALPYAKGIIENAYLHYIRDDGLTKYRANEVAQQARMLTILALYHSYSGDSAFLLRHFARAKALADWLKARREVSLAMFSSDDPRYGLIAGLDEGDTFSHVNYHQGPYPTQHWYSHIAEAYRAFTEIGQIWVTVGLELKRPDVVAHGAELLKLAPDMYQNLHDSLGKTLNTTASPGHKCWPDNAGMFQGHKSFGGGCSFRAYPEMFYSGALTAEQTDAMYTSGQGVTNCTNTERWLTDGSPSNNNPSNYLIFSHIPQGLPFGLLVHDFVERFLLYFFHQSAHAQTRGTFTTPESTFIDVTKGGYGYASAGEANIPMALKWMLCFEEPETRTLWFAKATPRDWLAAGQDSIAASQLATRYGRAAFTLTASAAPGSRYTVHVNITMAATFALSAATTPAGGLRVRIRAPIEHAGKLSKVTVSGKPWADFDAAEETINFAADKLTADLVATGLTNIVAVFGAGTAVPLRPARIDLPRRYVPVPPSVNFTVPPAPVLDKPADCPDRSTLVDSFELNGTAWSACEDLQQPGGDVVLVSGAGDVERFEKSYARFTTNYTDDVDYYLGLSKAAVANATTDILGAKLLSSKGALSWAAVERAVPPIRSSGHGPAAMGDMPCKGVRTFVGSRSAAVDTVFDDQGGDCNWDGWPTQNYLDKYTSWTGYGGYVINMHNKAVGQPLQLVNRSSTAEGNVGGVLPTVVFYLEMIDNLTSVNRYWTYTALATPDICPTPANGCREQDVLFRFQQLGCSGPNKKPPCKMIGWPMYWNSYWWSRFPGANASDTEVQTLETGPVNATSAGEFYLQLLNNRVWWTAELAKEGMMELSLPSPATTNGTWLELQSRQAIVRSMITRENTWHPRYGVRPGYGNIDNDGLLPVFIATATAALEWGAIPYASGVIDNQFSFYVRTDGMIWHRGYELPATARMLTILAAYHSYSSGDDANALLLKHFSKAKAVAMLLLNRRAASTKYSKTDPRYGIPYGGDEARDGGGGMPPSTPMKCGGSSACNITSVMAHADAPVHWYASAAELYRACTELGEVWVTVGKSADRPDIAAHGKELLQMAPLLYTDLHTSLNRTLNTSVASGERCWQQTVEPIQNVTSFRGMSEMLFSGALSASQAADIYTAAAGGSACGAPRLLTMGSPGIGGPTIASPTAYGFAFGLLQHDMVEEYLLHYFTMSAHGYTRGTYTSPESSNLADRDVPTIAYTAAGVMTSPVYLKWLLCFEEPETKTLWLGKAVPRDWLVAGEAPLVATNLTTRYGRISFSMSPPPTKETTAAPHTAEYTVRIAVNLPETFTVPAGGLQIRVRAPVALAGKLSKVTVGGDAWTEFDAKAETITISASKLTPELIKEGLPNIVASF